MDPLNCDEVELLRRYRAFLDGLATGRREPETHEQRHFVAVVRGLASPATTYEIAYMKWMATRSDLDVLAAELSSHRRRQESEKAAQSSIAKKRAGKKRSSASVAKAKKSSGQRWSKEEIKKFHKISGFGEIKAKFLSGGGVSPR